MEGSRGKKHSWYIWEVHIFVFSSFCFSVGMKNVHICVPKMEGCLICENKHCNVPSSLADQLLSSTKIFMPIHFNFKLVVDDFLLVITVGHQIKILTVIFIFYKLPSWNPCTQTLNIDTFLCTFHSAYQINLVDLYKCNKFIWSKGTNVPD